MDEAAPRTIEWSQEEFTEVRPGILGSTVHTPQLTVTMYRYRQGSRWEEHEHPQDQVTTVLSGTIEFTVDGAPVTMTAGQTAVLPGGVRHEAAVLEGDVVTLNVFTRREQAPKVG